MNKSIAGALWCIVFIVAVCAAVYCGDKLGLLGEEAVAPAVTSPTDVDSAQASSEAALAEAPPVAPPAEAPPVAPPVAPPAVEAPEPAVKPQARFILSDLSANEEAALLAGYLSSGGFLARVSANEDIAGAKELRLALRDAKKMFFSTRAVPGLSGAVIIEVSGCSSDQDALLLANAGSLAICAEMEQARRRILDMEFRDQEQQLEYVEHSMADLSDRIRRMASMASQGDAVKWNTMIEALTLRELELTDELRAAAGELRSLREAQDEEQYSESALLQETFAADVELQRMSGEMGALLAEPAGEASDQADRKTALSEAIQARQAQLVASEVARQESRLQGAMATRDMVRDERGMAIEGSRSMAATMMEIEALRSQQDAAMREEKSIRARIGTMRTATLTLNVTVLMPPLLVR